MTKKLKKIKSSTLMDKWEVVEALQISYRTLTNYQQRGLLAPMRDARSGRMYYNRSDVEALNENRFVE
jgi:DNA-binding transcriptional MerR regulator